MTVAEKTLAKQILSSLEKADRTEFLHIMMCEKCLIMYADMRTAVVEHMTELLEN